MSRKCDICGKGPIVGNNVSHAHNKTKKWLRPNLHSTKVIIDGQKKKLKVCSKCLKSSKLVKAVS